MAAGGPRAAAAVPGGPGAVLRLPRPSGPYPVGRTTLYLVDTARPDPWDAGIPVRELVASVLYPAAGPARLGGGPYAPQLDPGTVPLFTAVAPLQHPGLPVSGVDWGATASHARVGAAARAERFPVLLYSPGGGDPRTLGTALAQDLASHGFVVVAVDHPGDALAVEFPVTTAFRPDPVRMTVLTGDPRTDPERFRTLIDTRVADLRFVLGRLGVLARGGNPDAAGRPLPPALGRALDPGRTGVYGHSAGGTAAAETLHEDPRVAAGADLEGYLDYATGELLPVARAGTGGRPLLLLATEGFADRAALDRSWDALLAAAAPGTVARHRIAGAAHWTFTDLAALAPQLQARGLMTAAARASLVGTLPPRHAAELVGRTLRTFFRRSLG
ncbi:MAG: alpha/beta hydrolase [Streptomyces sp.]|nr:alpha/beta hydrolase [Streptomyces sp.]